jgi:hypothetical protein
MVISWRSRSLLKLVDRLYTIRRIVSIVTVRSSPIRTALVTGRHTVKRPRRTVNEDDNEPATEACRRVHRRRNADPELPVAGTLRVPSAGQSERMERQPVGSGICGPDRVRDDN